MQALFGLFRAWHWHGASWQPPSSADLCNLVGILEEQAVTSFLSPDGRRFTSTITAAPGAKPKALDGSERRGAP